MKIKNLKKAWVEITDISFRVPPGGKGDTVIPDALAAKSKDLHMLQRAGIFEFVESPITGMVSFNKDGMTCHMVPSTDIWSSSGNRNKIAADVRSLEPGKVTATSDPGAPSETREKRFLIEKTVESAVFIDEINLALNKFKKSAHMTAETYFSAAVQKAVNEKVIKLVSVEELVGEEWVPMKIDHSNPSAVLASDGDCCVFWEGPIFDGGGYANMNRQYITNLDASGVRVKPSLIPTSMEVEDSVRKKLMTMSGTMIPLLSPKVYATTVPGKHYGRSVSYTMMETEGRIHPLYVHRLLAADEIWVPCEWNREVFAASGVKRDMRIMPLGVDVETYIPRKQSVYFSGGTKGFTFLSVFNWNWRKGPDVMIKAYARAFTSKDDVSMILVSRYTYRIDKASKQIHSDIKSYISREKSSDLPHLVLVDEVIPTFMMPLLYNSATACVQVSRGEGFGLPACEAAASGVPLLASDHGGHRMFLDSDVATLVVPDAVKKVDKSIEWISPFYHDMEFVDYSDKAIDEVAEKMRWMYNNRDRIAEMAIPARNRVVSNFNWRTCADRVKSRLQEIQP